jgi:hypothetical protein
MQSMHAFRCVYAFASAVERESRNTFFQLGDAYEMMGYALGPYTAAPTRAAPTVERMSACL